MTHTATIPPVAVGASGRLPFLVQAAEDTAARAEQLAARTELAAQITAAVHTALARTIPDVDADTAASIAADIAARLTLPEPPAPGRWESIADTSRPGEMEFCRAVDAITAAVDAANDPEVTRRGLHGAVDVHADEAQRP